MKKALLIIIAVLLLMAAGCSGNDLVLAHYTYKGENDDWAAEYQVGSIGLFTEKNGSMGYDSITNKKLTVTYKKDLPELFSVKQLSISYKSSVSGGKIEESYDQDEHPGQKTYTLGNGGGKSRNAAVEQKDEIIQVIITLDGETQTIELKNIG